ncbi:MAG: hypothetical protein J1F02_07990 [Lachnospiraceae bacterium]|nr:hypothetical protein [Lachnospiraceae bacterium]
MKSRLKTVFYLLLMFGAVCTLGKGQTASAAESGYDNLGHWDFGDNKVITGYDVTGDGQADSIKIAVTKVEDKYESNIGKLEIYVNDKLAFQESAFEMNYWVVNFVSLENGKVFFDISNMIVSDDVGLHALYEYKEGKLQSFYDFMDLYGDGKHIANCAETIKSVKGNTITVAATAQFFVTGAISYNVKLNYTNKGFKKNSDRYSILYGKYKKNRWTAARKIKVYQKAGGKKAAYVLKKGNVIKINKIIYKNNKIFFKVRNKKGKGKTGYIPAAMKFKIPNYFKEAVFVG